MALKPSPPPQHPGPTGVGSNKPTPGAGLTEDERKEQEFLAKKLEEDERKGLFGDKPSDHLGDGAHVRARDAVEERAGEVLTASFSITNNGTGDLDIYQLGVDPVGMINQRYMKSLKPRATVAIESPMNAIRIKLAEPGGVVPTAVLYGFPA
jgi:hypothetical protein